MEMGLDDRPGLDRRAAEAIIAWNSRGSPLTAAVALQQQRVTHGPHCS
jgi:hypothetical protein